MQINGVQFNVELTDILKELREQLSANGIQRFAKIVDSGEDVMVCCPYHKDGQEKRPSCGIRKADGLLHCLACGKTAGLDEVIANCFGRQDPLWGYQWLTKNFLTVEVHNREAIKVDMARPNISNKGNVLASDNLDKSDMFVTEEELDTYRYTHPYMYKRGLTDEIIELFDIGYDKKTDSITFPVRYWGSANFGACMFVARRQIKTKRFDIPKGIEKPLYGAYEIWRDFTNSLFTKGIKMVDKIYVCEGLFDCLRLWCNGKYAVAGFGCLFSEYQIKQLEGLPTRHLVLAMDNDEAGREARKKLRARIKNKLITEVVIPKDKKDIGELTDEEIQNLQEVINGEQRTIKSHRS